MRSLVDQHCCSVNMSSKQYAGRKNTKLTKIFAEQESNFWIDFEERYSSTKLLKDTFE